jgi:hypothetical protein
VIWITLGKSRGKSLGLRRQGRRQVRRSHPRHDSAPAGGTGYLKTGFLNTLEHKALMAGLSVVEIAAVAGTPTCGQ